MPMRTSVALLATTALLLAVTACGSEGDEAVDPGPAATGAPPSVPAAAGLVRSRNLATVMDAGRVELCLGPVAESYPPQCSGPEIVNWDWTEHGHDMFEQQGDVRWGTFAVTGRWDGTTFEVTETVPGPLYDAMPAEPLTHPDPATAHDEDELARISERVADLPGAVSAWSDGTRVLVEVVHDDGTLQERLDGEHGQDVVRVVSLLVPAG